MASATPSLEAYLGAGLLISAFDRSNATNFPLELHHAVKKRFCCRRATRHINIHRHDPVTAAHNAIAIVVITPAIRATAHRSEEHTSELQSLMRISYADFCL